MRDMGVLHGKIKYTFVTMFIATLAIAGIPPLSGFFSKDSILFNALTVGGNGGKALYGVGLLTALLTSFYMFRLIYLTFYGKPRYDEHHVHVHESPWSMFSPLVVLAVLSIVGGWVAAPAFWGGLDHFAAFLYPVFGTHEAAAGLSEAQARALELWLAGVAVASAAIGWAVAFWLYLKEPGKPEQLAKSLKGIYTTLYNKYFMAKLYPSVIVLPLVWLSNTLLSKI